ncbi:MAG TPA: hypothetical protein VM900_07820 [Sphingomonas sp.]|jgi:hypothetical protein|nr:hypothetical protein [Sphingomonas sp.]
MIASTHTITAIADKIAARPAPATEWSPVAVAELLRQVERALVSRQAA